MSKVVAMPEPIEVYDHGTGQIDIRHLHGCTALGYSLDQGRITEVHHKSDGALDGGPSLAFVASIPMGGFIVSQITVRTLNTALKKIGLQVCKL